VVDRPKPRSHRGPPPQEAVPQLNQLCLGDLENSIVFHWVSLRRSMSRALLRLAAVRPGPSITSPWKSLEGLSG